MSIELNHTIIWARDKAKSAAFLAGILDLPVGEQWGPFVPVQVSNGVTLDYADAEDIQPQHYAFLLNEDEFDAAWRAPASVDSHRSGTMVYEEKYGSGIDTPEVYRRV